MLCNPTTRENGMADYEGAPTVVDAFILLLNRSLPAIPG